MTPATASRPGRPTAAQIAFERLTRITDEFVTNAIWLMNPDGSNPSRLTEPPQFSLPGARDGMPDWSPDGRLIAFTRSYRGRRDIHVIHPDGTRGSVGSQSRQASIPSRRGPGRQTESSS